MFCHEYKSIFIGMFRIKVGDSSFPAENGQQASTGHPEFEQPYGPTVPAYYALIAQAHMAEFGTTQEQFASIAVACRAHAARNPAAQMRDLISVEDVLESRMIADPLHLLDCSLVSDGGSAIVLTSSEPAADR